MTATVSTDARLLVADPEAIRAFWDAIARPGEIREVRIPDTKRGGPCRFFGTQSGYFDNANDLVNALRCVTGADADAVYITLNPTKPELLARAANHLRGWSKSTTADADIIARCFLLIDCDAVRSAGISSTGAERDAALDRRDAIRAYLTDLGWTAPCVVTMSGNGGALLYAVDLPNDADSTALVEHVLKALATQFNDGSATVDTTVSNAARITKIPGTVAAKGDPIPDRPWRVATAEYPEGACVITRDQLAALAAPVLQPEPRQQRTDYTGGGREWTVEKFLTLNDLTATIKRKSYGVVYELDRCLTSQDHTDSAVIIEFLNGALAYSCRHNRCQGMDWVYLRAHNLAEIPEPATASWPINRNGHTHQVIPPAGDGWAFGGSDGSTDDGEAPESPWPALQPLPSITPVVPELPADMVPVPFRPWLTDASDRAAIPLVMPTVPAVVALGAVVGRQLGIKPSRWDDYLVVPNLWGGIVARPSMMKTYAVDEGLRPINQLAATARERFAGQIDAASAKQDRVKAEVGHINGKFKEALRDGKATATIEAELAAKKRELREAEAIERRYLTHDVTVEKLGELLRDNPRGMLLGADELARLLRTFDKPGRETDRAFFIEAWAGTGSYTVDRIARGTIHIPALCLSIVGGIQPGRLSRYVREALGDGDGADGLLQRFQLLVWPDGLGEWDPPSDWPDHQARAMAVEIYRALDELDPTTVHATVDDGTVPYLRFDQAGQALYDQWRDELERRLRSAELAPFPAFEAHIAKYRSLMPTLALLFHLAEAANRNRYGPINVDAAALAAAWCEYLELHARKVYALELSGEVDAAHALAEKIDAGLIVDRHPVRDLYRTGWMGLARSEQVYAGLEVLARHGWVRLEAIAAEGARGGRPSEVVRLHPELRGGRGA